MTPILLDFARKSGFTLCKEESALREMLEQFAKFIIEHEALKQPDHEPAFWYYTLVVEGQVVNEAFTTANWDTRFEPFGRRGVDHGGEVTKEPLYTTPPAAPYRAIEARLREKNSA